MVSHSSALQIARYWSRAKSRAVTTLSSSPRVPIHIYTKYWQLSSLTDVEDYNYYFISKATKSARLHSFTTCNLARAANPGGFGVCTVYSCNNMKETCPQSIQCFSRLNLSYHRGNLLISKNTENIRDSFPRVMLRDISSHVT